MQLDRLTSNLPLEAPYEDPPFEQIFIPQTKNIFRNKKGKLIRGMHVIANQYGFPVKVLVHHRPALYFPASQLSDLIQPGDNGTVYVTMDHHEVDVLLKSLGEEACRGLLASGRWIEGDLRVWYTPKLSLTLRRKKDSIRIFSLSNWAMAGNVRSLLEKAELPTQVARQEDYPKLAEELGWRIHSVISPHMPEANMDLASPSSLVSSLLQRDLGKIRMDEVPLEAQELAYQCLHAPWIETFQKGTIEDSADYDLISAYPNELLKLYNIDKVSGKWKSTTTFEPEATYGFYRAIIEVKQRQVSPIRFRAGETLFSPFGVWIGYITQPEINFIQAHNSGKVEVLYGWTFHRSNNLKPFARTYTRMLNLRRESKEKGDLFKSSILKYSIARASGKFLQRIQNMEGEVIAGNSFCPIYACEVMTQTKLHLAEIALKKPNSVVAITVDGLLTDHTFKKPKDEALREEVRGVTSTFLSPLLFHIPGKVSQFDLFAAIDRDPESSYIELPQEHRISLCEAIQADRFEKAGQTYITTRQFPLNYENRRYWPERLKAAKELRTRRIRSEPIMIHEVLLKKQPA